MEKFSSKVVLITGASSGFGAEIARSFAKCKASLSITGRNETNLNKVAEECKELGASQVMIVVGDLKKKAVIEGIISQTIETYKKLDILVNNAGIAYPGGIREITWDEFDEVMGTNLKPAVFITQMALPHLERTKGNVVNMSSIMSEMPYPYCLSYCLSKSSLDQFTRTTALELSGKGIRVNSVNSGYCHTNVRRNFSTNEEEDRQFFESKCQSNPLESGKITVKDVADAVLFLASDSASMITGTCLKVDAGRFLSGQS